MISIGRHGHFCLKKKSFQVQKSQSGECKTEVRLAELTQYPELYENTIMSWSMKNFNPDKESGHDHFFNSFYKFIPLVSDYRPEFLADVMMRAAGQNENYMEIMILADEAASTRFAKTINKQPTFFEKQKTLLHNQAFQSNIQKSIQYAKSILSQARNQLKCKQSNEMPSCKMTVKFQYYVLREQPIDKVFAQALTGFEAANQSEEIIAVNLVQAEDGPISLRDYHQQMQIFHFLHQQYPKVHISLHAGELTKELVTKKDLSFHIRDAIETGNAMRIGHGVDILSENQSKALLKEMAKNDIAVEVNLISNFKILSINQEQHPLKQYLNAKVPVVLSTDDEGILRTSLTEQYLVAAKDFGLDYPTIKQINRNALSYSFLDGQSLWQDNANAKPVAACQNLNASTCLKFIHSSKKAQIQWQLEQQLLSFEKRFESRTPNV
jgi:adenosine deaminase